MVSIRSDDIRGRWGRLIDNTASFTSLDLSGQASGITAAISGQVLAGNISGQVSGFAIGPTTVVAGSATFSQIIVQSGLVAQQISGSSLNLQSGLTVPIISGSSINLQSGLVVQQISGSNLNLQSGLMTQQISGANLNVSGLIFGAGSGTTLTVSGVTSSVYSGSTLNLQSGVVGGAIIVSGIAIFNGQITIGANASGISFSGLQRLPTMEQANYEIIFANAAYQAINTNTGIIESSGSIPDSVINYAIETSTSGSIGGAASGALVLLGPYTFNLVSGIQVQWDNITLRGAGVRATRLVVSGHIPAIELRAASGNLPLANINIENMHFEYKNSGYNNSLLAIRTLSGKGSIEQCTFKNLRFYDNNFYRGNAIEIDNTYGPFLYNVFENIRTDGFENAVLVTATSGIAISSGINWATSNTFRNMVLSVPFIGFKFNQLSGASFYASNFEDIWIQTQPANSGASPVGHSGTWTGWMFDDNGQHTDINITNSIVWDYNSNSGQSFAQVNNRSKLVCIGCSDPTVSGTGVISGPLSGGALIYMIGKGIFSWPIPATFMDDVTIGQDLAVVKTINASGAINANNFLIVTTNDSVPTSIIRPNNSVGAGVGIALRLQNTSGTNITNGLTRAVIVSNIQGAEQSRMGFQVLQSGALVEYSTMRETGMFEMTGLLVSGLTSVFNNNLTFVSGVKLGQSGQGVLSYNSGRVDLSGLNWIGSVQGSSAPLAASGGAIPTHAKGWITIQVSGQNVQIPFF